MYFSSISVRAALILLAVTVEVAWDAVGFVGNERANAQPEGCRVSLSDVGFVFTFTVHTHLCSLLNIFSLRTLCNLNLFFTVNARCFLSLLYYFLHAIYPKA